MSEQSVAHHTVALAMGNDDWNTTYSGAMALGDDSKIGLSALYGAA